MSTLIDDNHLNHKNGHAKGERLVSYLNTKTYYSKEGVNVGYNDDTHICLIRTIRSIYSV